MNLERQECKEIDVNLLKEGNYGIQFEAKKKENNYIEWLAKSMKRKVLEPLIVAGASEGSQEYEVIHGNKRLQAARLAGLERLPCKVIPPTTTSYDRRIINSVENANRKDISVRQRSEYVQKLWRAIYDEDVDKFGPDYGGDIEGAMVVELGWETHRLFRYMNFERELSYELQKIVENESDIDRIWDILSSGVSEESIPDIMRTLRQQNLDTKTVDYLIRLMGKDRELSIEEAIEEIRASGRGTKVTITIDAKLNTALTEAVIKQNCTKQEYVKEATVRRLTAEALPS